MNTYRSHLPHTHPQTHARILFNAQTKSMVTWSKEETLKLIEIWGEDTIQGMLEGSRRNQDVFAKISHEMEAAGYAEGLVKSVMAK